MRKTTAIVTFCLFVCFALSSAFAVSPEDLSLESISIGAFDVDIPSGWDMITDDSPTPSQYFFFPTSQHSLSAGCLSVAFDEVPLHAYDNNTLSIVYDYTLEVLNVSDAEREIIEVADTALLLWTGNLPIGKGSIYPAHGFIYNYEGYALQAFFINPSGEDDFNKALIQNVAESLVFVGNDIEAEQVVQDLHPLTLQSGIWTIGSDVPAGNWDITVADGQWALVQLGSGINESNTSITGIIGFEILTSPTSSLYESVDKTNVNWILNEDQYLYIDFGEVILTPHTY